MTALIAPNRSATGSSRENIPSGYKKGTLQNFTPEQMQLFQSLFGNLGSDSFLSRLSQGEEGLFDEMEAPANRQFAQQLGGIANRFSGMGMGARHSSGFQNATSQAASDFAQDLQSKRLGLQRQALNDLMGMSEQLLGQRPQENFLVEKQKKIPGWQKFLGGALPVAGGIAGGFLGGPAGASIGSQAGSAAARSFF